MNALSCSRSQRPRYYIGIASLLSLSLVLAPTPALAQRGGSAEAAELARCIRIAARGYGWLEQTLWGLRKQALAVEAQAQFICAVKCRNRRAFELCK